MSDAVADTHALIWYLADSPRLGKKASQVFEQCDRGEAIVFIPTISLVEIVYLKERNRISPELTQKLTTALSQGGSGLAIFDLTSAVVDVLAKIGKDQVPEMPDRIIAATALYLDLPLMSRDHRMPLSGVQLIW